MLLLQVPSKLGFKPEEGECIDFLFLGRCCLAGKFCFLGDIWQYLQIYSVTALGLGPISHGPYSQTTVGLAPASKASSSQILSQLFFLYTIPSLAPHMLLVIMLPRQDPLNPMT